VIGLVEIGQYLGGVSDDTVRRYIARGDLIGYRLPGSRLIACKLTDLDAFVAAGRITTARDAS
jgi:excisionase family DNA binding protein